MRIKSDSVGGRLIELHKCTFNHWLELDINHIISKWKPYLQHYMSFIKRALVSILTQVGDGVLVEIVITEQVNKYRMAPYS